MYKIYLVAPTGTKGTENLLIREGKNSARWTIVTKKYSHKSRPGENHYWCSKGIWHHCCMVRKHFAHVVLQKEMWLENGKGRSAWWKKTEEVKVANLESLSKVCRCFPTRNSCLSSQGNSVHDLNSFQGKSVTKSSHKFSIIYLLWSSIYIRGGKHTRRRANICIQHKTRQHLC